MTREEAIKRFQRMKKIMSIPNSDAARTIEALDIAIEALKREQPDEWCTDCKEYDTEKKCCPRFNKVIREALKREPSEDGTLEVKVEDATKIGRVLISDDKHRGGLYYPDEYEPQSISFENDTEIKSCSKDSDLISRAEAIDKFCTLGTTLERRGKLMITMVDAKYLFIEIIENLPSADRPQKAIAQITFDEEKLREIVKEAVERFKEEYEIADKPRGEWIEMGENKDGTHNIRCDQCGESFKARGHANSHNTKKKYRFCPSCGADMRGEDE